MKKSVLFLALLSLASSEAFAANRCLSVYHDRLGTMAPEVKKAERTLRTGEASGIGAAIVTFVAANLIVYNNAKQAAKGFEKPDPAYVGNVVSLSNIFGVTWLPALGVGGLTELLVRLPHRKDIRKAGETVDLAVDLKTVQSALEAASVYDQLRTTALPRLVSASEDELLSLRDKYETLRPLSLDELAHRIYASDLGKTICPGEDPMRMEQAVQVWSGR